MKTFIVRQRNSIPRFITRRYSTGVRGFRQEKRRLVCEMQDLLHEFRFASVYTPCGREPFEEISRQLGIIKEAVSVKTWGG